MSPYVETPAEAGPNDPSEVYRVTSARRNCTVVNLVGLREAVVPMGAQRTSP